MIRFKSLQQRYSIFMLLPVAILLLSMGYAGFTYTRNHLLTQWGESTNLKLQRAAHFVDMRLNRPKQMLNLFHSSAGMPNAVLVEKLILDRIRALDEVARVDLTWVKKEVEGSIEGSSEHPMHHSINHGETMMKGMMKEGFGMMPFSRGSIVDITPPRFDSSSGGKTISLISDLKDENNQTIGKLDVAIRFDYLVGAVEATGWWQEHKAYLVDDTGRILVSNLKKHEQKLGENNDPLERSVLYSMKSLPFGTVIEQGFRPKEVIGFYKLEEAPWTLVISAPGSMVLSSIIHFSLYYLSFGGLSVLVILFLIRFVTGRTVLSIKDVSLAAHRVAGGDYDVSLPLKTDDEVGELIRSFNTMVLQLEDRAHLKYSLNLASQVQQNLLPGNGMKIDTLDVAGRSIYCDETGGDYYDYLEDSESRQDRVGIAVGDVSDHGIAASLFMTTARALIRSRFTHGGSLAHIVTDVNHLLCEDTARTGNFMTLFFALFDIRKKEIQWVRAGHDPAILYDAAKDDFLELGGKGMALGVDENFVFNEYVHSGWNYGQILIIGTDGIWDTENQTGERFGKERLRKILRNNSHVSAEKILTAVTDALATFRQGQTQGDDVTLVVIKAKTNP